MLMKQHLYNIVARYSSKVGLDLPYFIKGGFWLSVGQFFNLLKGIVLSIIFANLLPKEVFGEYSFIMTVLGIAGIFAVPGMGVAVVQAVAKGYEKTHFRALKEVFKWSWLGSLFLLCFSVCEYFFEKFNLSIIFLILSSLFPLYSVSGFYPNFFNGKRRFDILVKLSSSFDIISTILICVVFLFIKSVFWIVVVSVLMQILIQGYFSLIYVKKFVENDNIDESSIKFGRNISFSMAFTDIANNFDSLIVASFLGFSDLAIFKIVTLLPNQIKRLANTFTPLLLPKIASKDMSKKDIMKHFKKFFLVVVSLILVYLAIAPFIFKYVYPKYYEYVWLSMGYHLSFIAFLNLMPYTYLLKEKENILLNKFHNYSSLLLIVTSTILIYFFGLLGAIVSRVIYRFFTMFVLFFYFFKKELPFFDNQIGFIITENPRK
jgi:O-antigen/teichoic acid export membrane protein